MAKKRVAITSRCGDIVAYAWVSPDDLPLVSRYSWCLDSNRAASHGFMINGERFRILMHRLILDAPKGMDVDHIDHNRLNNTRENIRICTHAENMMNTRGVGVHFRYGKWRAQIQHRRQLIHIGSFRTKKEAIYARKLKEQELRGRYAYAS
jgi:hypothetical protein